MHLLKNKSSLGAISTLKRLYECKTPPGGLRDFKQMKVFIFKLDNCSKGALTH